MFLNTSKVERVKGFEPIPAGTYRALVTKAEGRDYEEDRYLSLTFDVLEGPHKGRKVFQSYSVKTKNEFMAKKGASDMAALALALGHPGDFKYEAEYLQFVKDKICLIKVVQKKRNKQSDEMKNEIVDYLPDGDAPSSAPGDPRTSDDIPW